MVPSESRMIGTDFLQARLNQDWNEFRSRGRAVVAPIVPTNNRQDFRDAFLKLQEEGCHADVLFSCIYVFLNSRPSTILSWTQDLKFPSSEKWKQIRDGLDRVRQNMEALMNETGMATLKAGNWDLDLDEFCSFYMVHDDLLGTMERYICEIDDLCRVLPGRTDIIKQYGQAVIWTYISSATKLSPPEMSSLTQTLLGLFYEQDPPKGDIPTKWERDSARFQSAYPDFYLNAKSFLAEKHLSSLKLPLPAPDSGTIRERRQSGIVPVTPCQPFPLQPGSGQVASLFIFRLGLKPNQYPG